MLFHTIKEMNNLRIKIFTDIFTYDPILNLN